MSSNLRSWHGGHADHIVRRSPDATSLPGPLPIAYQVLLDGSHNELQSLHDQSRPQNRHENGVDETRTVGHNTLFLPNNFSNGSGSDRSTFNDQRLFLESQARVNPGVEEGTSRHYIRERDRGEDILSSRPYTRDSMSGVSFSRSNPHYEHQSEFVDSGSPQNSFPGHPLHERPHSDPVHDMMDGFHSMPKTGTPDGYSGNGTTLRLRTGSLDSGRGENGRTGYRGANHHSPSSPYDVRSFIFNGFRITNDQ